MSKSNVQEKNLSNLINENFDKKKPLKKILLSYFEKKHLKDVELRKIKEEFSELELDMKDAKSSYETIMEIQKKLSKKLNRLKDEKKSEKKS